MLWTAVRETAKSLGVNLERIRQAGILVSCLIAAVAVSFLGIIGFIGLVGPHIMRRIIGGDHRYLIPGSALMGSLLLLVSDTLARTMIAPVVLPVGAITSFFGAPLFLYLLIRGINRDDFISQWTGVPLSQPAGFTGDQLFHLQRDFPSCVGDQWSRQIDPTKCMNWVLEPCAGTVFIGNDEPQTQPQEIAQKIGYVPQHQDSGSITVFDAVLPG